ncbi:hypothetical protein BC89_27940 [Pseudomonas monteilii]|nr:hypothetical protein BC89_27940 [Pseudomonas monteilii]
MPLNVKAGGSWRAASKVHVKVSGAWAVADQLWGYMSGGWRSAWQNEVRYINTANRTAASVYELMGSPTQPGNYIFENQATISAGTGTYALRTGVFPAGSTLLIVNKGYIRGKGGNGGTPTVVGAAGGTALYVDMDCTIDNTNGYIFGGGGGGGGASCVSSALSVNLNASGGGGAGSAEGAGGTTTQVGSPGTATTGGAGGSATYTAIGKTWKAVGGAGGANGAAGVNGSYITAGGTGWVYVTKAGGAAGAAIARNGKTVTITGGNNTTQIKGAIA